MKDNLTISTLLLAFTICRSSLIWEFKPQSHLQQNFKDELIAAHNPKTVDKIDYGTYSYGMTTISNIKQILYYIEVNTLAFTLNEDNSQVMSSKNSTLSLAFNFTYDNDLVKNSSGTFYLSTSEFNVTKKYTDVNVFGASASFLLKLSKLTYEGYSSSRPQIEETITRMFNEKGNKLILDVFNSDLSTYYTSISNKTSTLHLTSYMPELEFTLDLTPDALPVSLNTSLVFSRLGYLNDHKNDSDVQPQFNNGTSYQFALSRKVLQNFLGDLIANGTFDFSLTQDNRPAKIFNMDIQSLGQIIPEVYYKYTRSERIKAYNTFVTLNYDNDKEKFSGVVVMNTVIYCLSDMSKVFEFKTEFKFNFLLHVNELMQMNLFVDKDNFNLNKLYIVSSDYQIVYRSTLISWVKATFSEYLKENVYVLLKSNFNLKDILIRYDDAQYDEFGIRIYGA